MTGVGALLAVIGLAVIGGLPTIPTADSALVAPIGFALVVGGGLLASRRLVDRWVG